MIESLLQNLTTDAAGESLSALCSEAKTKAGRAAIEAALSDRSALYSLLKSDSPKVRKNTYRLIGALQNKEDIRALEEALQTETTLFAVPSLLLALGALGAKDALCRYTVPASEGPEQDKHIAAIEAAYEKAAQQFDRVKAEPLCRLPAAREILCCAPKGFAAELADELDGLGFSGTVQGDAVRIVTADVARVYRAACMTEALLPIAEKVPLEPAAIAKAAGKCIGTRYRIELRGYLKDRAKLIERLKTRLDGVNSASNYDCELRIQCSGSAADLFWKLWNVPDERSKTRPLCSIRSAAAARCCFRRKRRTRAGACSASIFPAKPLRSRGATRKRAKAKRGSSAATFCGFKRAAARRFLSPTCRSATASAATGGTNRCTRGSCKSSRRCLRRAARRSCTPPKASCSNGCCRRIRASSFCPRSAPKRAGYRRGCSPYETAFPRKTLQTESMKFITKAQPEIRTALQTVE